VAAYVNRVEFQSIEIRAPLEHPSLTIVILNPLVLDTALSETHLCRIVCARSRTLAYGEATTTCCGQVRSRAHHANSEN
jgi:hypothetical protein